MTTVERNTNAIKPAHNNDAGSSTIVERTGIPADLYDSNKYGMFGNPNTMYYAGRSTRNINKDEYTKYIPNDQFDINLPLDVLNEQRAQNQVKALSGIIIFLCGILLLLSFYLIRRTTRKKFVPVNEAIRQDKK